MIYIKQKLNNITKHILTYAAFMFAMVLFFVSFATPASAVTEFVTIIDPDLGANADFSSLNSWEQTVNTDLTSANTLVFSISSSNGWWPAGLDVTASTSGATASTTLISSSSQVLLYNIQGTFQNGETVSLDGAVGNYVILSDTGDSVIAVAQCRSTGGTDDTSLTTVNGFTTNSTNYVKVWTDPDDEYGRHNGVFDDNKYVLHPDQGSDSVSYLGISDNDVVVEGLQIRNSDLNNDSISAITIGTSINTGNITIKNNILKGNGDNDWYDAGIYIDNADGNFYIKNNLVYDWGGNDVYRSCMALNPDGAENVYVYNNTVYNCNYGIARIDGDIYAYNNIVFGNDDDFTGSFSDNQYNASDDGDGSNNITPSDWNKVFVNYLNGDFHLKSSSILINAGTSTVFWDSNFPVQYDIDGTARGGAIDIGADEVPVEFVSTICEANDRGGDCSEVDYNSLGGTGNWESAVDSNLTLATTRVFSGSITGILNENSTVNLCDGTTDLLIDGVVQATTSDQILIDGITGTSAPLIASSGNIWSDEVCSGATNYWTISGTGDELGASPIAVAKIDGTWSASDTNAVDINGWTTDHDNYIKVYTTDLARHKGKWDYNKYRMVDSARLLFEISEAYAHIDGLQFMHNYSGANNGVTMLLQAYTLISDIKISNNIMRGEFSGITGSYRAYGIEWSNDEANAKIWNNILYNYHTPNGASDSRAICSCSALDSTLYIFNNTIYNSSIGINKDGSNPVILHNNIVASTTNPFDGSFTSESFNNATDGGDTPSGSSNPITNANFNFISTASGSEDFHLGDGSDAINAGVNLSATSTLNFLNDIDGGLRSPDDLGWDIGADEVAAKQYRSVGNDSSSLGSIGSVTISGRTATFTDAQADNVGVGDVIQFGGGSTFDLAFISGRTSSTTYSIQSWDTKAPSATTSAAFNIYRAHLLLDEWEDQVESYVNDNIDDSV